MSSVQSGHCWCPGRRVCSRLNKGGLVFRPTDGAARFFFWDLPLSLVQLHLVRPRAIGGKIIQLFLSRGSLKGPLLSFDEEDIQSH